MARWSIASYNRFIGARPEGVSVHDARALYRAMRGRLGRPIFRTDLKNHPRIRNQELKKIVGPPTLPPPPAPPKIIDDLDDLDQGDDEDDYDHPEYEGAFDSGKKGRK